MNVTLEEAYAEACRALGESVVRERLMSRELERLHAEAERPTAHPADRP